MEVQRKRKLSNPQEREAARIKREKKDSIQQILSTVRNQIYKVRDLHTHLLGMGSSTFWLDNLIMDSKIMPTNDDFEDDLLLRRFLGPLLWNPNTNRFFDPEDVQTAFDAIRDDQFDQDNASAAGLLMKQKVDECRAKLEYTVHQFEDIFSYDVIYELEHLRLSFDLPEVNSDIVQSQLESILGLTTNSYPNIGFHPYIIWNARLQRFEFIPRGISNGHLRQLLEHKSTAHSQALRSYMVNAFSMCSREGEKVTLVDLHAYRGNWAQFYPRRYKLKDSIYQQRLDVLAYLLQHCLHNYATCNPPVRYVEFSIGVGDLSRPWVLEVLSSYHSETQAAYNKAYFVARLGVQDENLENLKQQTLEGRNSFIQIHQQSKEHDDKHVLSFLDYQNEVEYHFLAGFNRSSAKIKNIVDVKSPVDILIGNGDAAIDYFNQEYNKNESLLFASAIKDLRDFAVIHHKEGYLENNLGPAQDDNPRFTYWIVGFDLFGEELGYPYCPFVTRPFLTFINTAMVHNPMFGVRIHCAETIPLIDQNLPGFALFCNHLYISFCIIKFLIAINIRVRIGHGVVFATVMNTNYNQNANAQRKSTMKLQYIQQHAQQVFSQTVFELNLTSNFYLLHNPHVEVAEKSVLGYLLKKDIPAILSTDDDGIWPLDTCHANHFKHHSLAHEICRAISENILPAESFNVMLENMQKFSFYGGKADKKPDQDKLSATIPSFIIAAPVAEALLTSIPQAQFKEELIEVIRDCAGRGPLEQKSMAAKLDEETLIDLAKHLAFFLGDESQELTAEAREILNIMKNAFLKGRAVQCQILHMIVDKDHHMIFLSQPKGNDKLIEGLKKLENSFIEGLPKKATFYVFIEEFDSNVVEAIKQLWKHSGNGSNLEAHIFTKTKNKLGHLNADLKCDQGTIKVDEKSEHMKRTNPVRHAFYDNQPFICFFGFNSSAVGSILKVLLASKTITLSQGEMRLIEDTFKPFYTDFDPDGRIIYNSSNKETAEINDDLRKKEYAFLPAAVLHDPFSTITISQRLNDEMYAIWRQIQNLQQIPIEEVPNGIKIDVQKFVIACTEFSIMPLQWCHLDDDFYAQNKPQLDKFSLFPTLEVNDNQFVCTKAQYSNQHDSIIQQMMLVFKKSPDLFAVLNDALLILSSKFQPEDQPNESVNQDDNQPNKSDQAMLKKRYETLWAHLLLQTFLEAEKSEWTYYSAQVFWPIIEHNLSHKKFDIFCGYHTKQTLVSCRMVLTNSQPFHLGHEIQRKKGFTKEVQDIVRKMSTKYKYYYS